MLSRKRRADGRLWLQVKMPDGKRRSLPAAWTSWEAEPDDEPRTEGRLVDYHALRQLAEVLEEAHVGERTEEGPLLALWKSWQG